MRIRGFILLFAFLLCFPILPTVNAIPTFHSGGIATPGIWTRLKNSNTSIFWSQADFFHYPWEAEEMHQLADYGIKVNFRINWWDELWNYFAPNSSFVDIYYNTTIRKHIEQFFDSEFSHLDLDKIWAVTLSEEQSTLWTFQDDPWNREAFQKHNETYHSETGYWLRWGGENETEHNVYRNWLNEKVIWVLNHFYDNVKSKWPHLQVFQFTYIPPFYEYLDISDLKLDAMMGDIYWAGGYYNQLNLYEIIRCYKTILQDKEYHLHLWGQEAWPEEVYSFSGGFEQIRKDAWTAYLSGVDAVGWFTWHWLLGTMWEREDILGKRLFLYLNRLNHELEKLPVFKPRSKVLALGGWEIWMPELGMFSELGLFNEWDTIYSKAFVKSTIDLSQYDLIIANEKKYSDDVIAKLNEYVKSGGNLVLLGGFGSQENIWGNGTRTTKFLMEDSVRTGWIQDHILANISEPNLLGLNLQYDGLEFISPGIEMSTLTDNHHPIGQFYRVDKDKTLTPLDTHPLVLYHNSSNPTEGWTLYWGILRSITNYKPEYEDVVKPSFPEWNYTRFLYRNVSRAFACNFLQLNGSVAKRNEENMLITQSQIEGGGILAGVSNYYNESKNITYILDLKTFNLPSGSYWVHSLDQNVTLGWFKSTQNLVEIPITIEANGTRLLLLSQEQLTPSYSVDIFPDIPTPEDVKDLWPTTATSTTTSPLLYETVIFGIDFIAISVAIVVFLIKWHYPLQIE